MIDYHVRHDAKNDEHGSYWLVEAVEEGTGKTFAYALIFPRAVMSMFGIDVAFYVRGETYETLSRAKEAALAFFAERVKYEERQRAGRETV